MAILCATPGELNFKLQWKWAVVVAMPWFKSSSWWPRHGLTCTLKPVDKPERLHSSSCLQLKVVTLPAHLLR